MLINQRGFVGAILVAACLSLIGENIVLVRRIAKSASARTVNLQSNVPALKVGDVIESAVFHDLGGQPRHFDAQNPTILFVFSSNCPFCRRNFANWRAIERRIGKSHVLYLALGTPDVRGFAHEQGIEDETVVLSRAEASGLRAFRIPETIEVSHGKIISIEIGVLSPREMSQIGLPN